MANSEAEKIVQDALSACQYLECIHGSLVLLRSAGLYWVALVLLYLSRLLQPHPLLCESMCHKGTAKAFHITLRTSETDKSLFLS